MYGVRMRLVVNIDRMAARIDQLQPPPDIDESDPTMWFRQDISQ